MEIQIDETYLVTIHYPWGEVRKLTSKGIIRKSDDEILLPQDLDTGLEGYIDCIIRETEEMLSGWLGGSCDTTATITPEPAE